MSEPFDLRASLGHALSDLGAGWNEDAAGHIRNALEVVAQLERADRRPAPAIPNLDALEEALTDLEARLTTVDSLLDEDVDIQLEYLRLGKWSAYRYALRIVQHAHNALRLTQEASE